MIDKKATSYEDLSRELDEVLSRLQSAYLDIDSAVKNYEQGMKIINELEKYLKDAENKITKIQQKWDTAS
jgi:exodeoxyribonuclease VII small subunit